MQKKIGAFRTSIVFGGAAVAALMPAFTTEVVTQAPLIGLSYVGVVLASAPMALSKRLSLQLLSRSIWWGTGMYGLLAAAVAYSYSYVGMDSAVGLFLAIFAGSAAALLAAGRSGLSQVSGVFAPKMARATLMTSIVLALADTQALLFYGLLSTESAQYGAAAKFGVAGAAMLVSLFGLYRLKIWGLAATATANVVIAALAITGVLQLPNVLAGALVATAVVQLLLPIPLMRKVLAGVREPASGRTDGVTTSTTAREEVVFSNFERAEAREAVEHRAHA